MSTSIRHALFSLAGILLLTACAGNAQKNAERLIAEAKTYFEQGRLDEARAAIDSLRHTYPTAVEIRRTALELYQRIELKRAQDGLALTDSLLQAANRQLQALQAQVEADKAALQATPEELTRLTLTRIRRDSLRTQFETLGAKIRYIHRKQKEL